MGTHSGMPGFSNTKLATTQRKNTISAPISSSNRQFQSQPRPSVGTPLPQPQHQQYMYQQHSRPTHNPHAQPSCPTLTARPTLAQVPIHPQGAQTNNIIPPHVHRRLEMYVKQTSTYQDSVDMLIQRASSAPEPNLNLQSGYRDIRTNLTKLEENVIALLEKNEHVITNDHLGSTYQQVCNTINWLNEQMINIEPRCLLVYIEPEMSSHYFRNAETTDFFL